MSITVTKKRIKWERFQSGKNRNKFWIFWNIQNLRKLDELGRTFIKFESKRAENINKREKFSADLKDFNIFFTEWFC